MKVLITGGSGFIGSAIRQELEFQGHEVYSFDRSTAPKNDVRHKGITRYAIKDFAPDTVIHLAGVLGTDELFDNPQLAIDVNITGTLNVLDACVEFGVSYIGITMPQVFPSIYTATKVAATRLASAYHHTHGLPVSHVRAFNAFGPGQHHGPGHPRKIIPALSVEAWSGAPLIVWGDGEQTVDLISTAELARIFRDVVINEVGNDATIDGGTGVKWTVNEVVRYILNHTDSNSTIDHRPMRRGEIPTQIVATGEGWEHLSFEPQFFMDELQYAIDSYREHPCVQR